MTAKSDIGKEASQILKALAEGDGPLANKSIATATGLDSKVVTNTMKKLKTLGLVDSPARCKYGITPAGKKELG